MKAINFILLAATIMSFSQSVFAKETPKQFFGESDRVTCVRDTLENTSLWNTEELVQSMKAEAKVNAMAKCHSAPERYNLCVLTYNGVIPAFRSPNPCVGNNYSIAAIVMGYHTK